MTPTTPVRIIAAVALSSLATVLASAPGAAQTPSPGATAGPMRPSLNVPLQRVQVHTTCGADPAAVSITYAYVKGARNQVDVIGTIKNIGNGPQSSHVAGYQNAYLYAIGMSSFRPNVPIATGAVPVLGINQEYKVTRRLTYPFTLGDVPTQFRLTFVGNPDIGQRPFLFDCDMSNDGLLVTADKRPFYPAGASTYQP